MQNNVLVDDAGNPRLDASGNAVHRTTTITPHGRTRGGVFEADDTNAEALPANPRGMNDRYRGGGGARGAGGDEIVRWNPTVNHEGAPADVTLVHELEHARHGTQGIMLRGNVDPATGDGVRFDRDHGAFPPVGRREHQVMGIGNSPQVPVEGGLTENQYREERRALGEAVPPRQSYRFPNGMPSSTAAALGF